MQAVITKYHEPTNTCGSRISARAAAGRMSFPYRHELNLDANHRAAAQAFIEAKPREWHKNRPLRYLASGQIHTGEYVHVLVNRRNADAY